ncbi:uncharacterized protein ACA1_181200 [Acanthamoeba castellanii str. Neff]|uniref:Uncharacterized protein n=1 Tax=Acanthamoeba castellanii (strain ATCC 30010 / Neff) TaxID=1257118 RepID=L8GCQ9_ACACF|nr:uncharacterized protein ACA1_181200 [Acanthamoeba castellanii str. Neff]ELR10867.1 hypothetical protein ACA1_181200 [Acanthamoeba castellanii str. Neff]
MEDKEEEQEKELEEEEEKHGEEQVEEEKGVELEEEIVEEEKKEEKGEEVQEEEWEEELESNPNIVSASLQVTHNNQAIHQQKEQLKGPLHRPFNFAPYLEAVDCNHRVVVWNLIEHWQWENVYEVLPAAAGMELSWIILDCISGFENYINLAGSVVLNAFEKALNYYTLGQNPLFQIILIKELNCLVPEGQVFISLDNLNSAMEADCCCEDPEELCHIWDWICVVEYIVLCGKNIEIEQPHSITSEVDTFCKHLFQSKLLSDEAVETSPHQL